MRPDAATRAAFARIIGSVSIVSSRVIDVPDQVIRASDAACARIVRLKARNFYYGMCLTPPDRRKHLYAVYAWMRHADDQIDQAPDATSRHAALRMLVEKTEAAISDRFNLPDDEGFWPAFRSAIRSCPIDPEWIREMLRGMADDTEHQGYSTVDDLLRYCYRVGGTVGQVCVAIWGFRRPPVKTQALMLAAARGRGFQLTNILRDIAVDAKGGEEETMPRCYVPRELFARHGLDASELLAWSRPDACTALIHELCDLAEAEFEASEGLEWLVHHECDDSLWAMTRIYRSVLARIRAQPRLSVQGRASIGVPSKVLVMVQAATGLWRA